MITEIFIFAAFLLTPLVSFYIPGALVVQYFGKKFSPLNKFILSWSVGLSIFILLMYLLSWIKFPFLLLFIILGCTLYAVLRKRNIFKINFSDIDYISIGIIILGSLSFVGITFFSGLSVSGGMQFIGTVNPTDGLMHLANIKMLLNTFPPVHPGLAGLPLRGYHYFYDLLLSSFVLFYHFSPEDLHYRFFSLFISLFYGFSFYLFAKALTDKKSSLRFILFFAYFAQGFAYIISFFVPAISPTNGFGVVQPIELILDPSVVLSIGMLLCGFYIILKMEKSISAAIIGGIILGILSEVKVYSGIIGIITLVSFAIYAVIIKKSPIRSYLISIITVAITTAITFLPNNMNAGSLLFYPLFPYENFMQQAFITSWHWEIVKTIYAQHHNLPRLVQMFIEAIAAFWVLSLGTRIVIIFGIKSFFKKTFWQKSANILTLLLILIPIIICSLFVESISIFDTKQFFWIAAALIAIPAGIFYGNLFKYVPFWAKVCIVVLLILFSWGGTINNENGYVFHPTPKLISRDEMSVIKTISTKVDDKSFIVVVPLFNNKPKTIRDLQWYPGPYITGLTGRTTYYEPESNAYSLQQVFSIRQKKVLELASALSTCNMKGAVEIMNGIGSPYLVTFTPIHCQNSSNYLQTAAAAKSLEFLVEKK
ncbi:MAG TPA: hypothetical protein VMR41_05840 [Patescibacteria group bacterium]|nr:hypothetical protein [Patescibacteria group bacterium]